MTTEDRLTEAYERGHFVATQRAISRQELGLPLDRPATDAELKRLSRFETLDTRTRGPHCDRLGCRVGPGTTHPTD